MLNVIDPNTMILGLLFIIFFTFIQLALGKTLGDKRSSTIIALCISLLSVYGINRTNFDVTGALYGVGINEEMIYIIAPILIIAGIVFMIWKLKIASTFMLLGIFLILTSFFAHETYVVLGVGIALLVLGIIFWFIKKKRGKNNPNSGLRNNSWNKNTPKIPKKKPLVLLLFMFGLALIIVNFITVGNIFVLGTGIGLIGLAILIWIFKLFKKKRTNSDNIPEKRRQKGIDNLIVAAKKFKSWAKDQKNPKFSGSWAMFIGWLKDGRWGRNEKDICNNLGITVNDFRWVFNKYGKV